jgi:hypothetical protein
VDSLNDVSLIKAIIYDEDAKSFQIMTNKY